MKKKILFLIFLTIIGGISIFRDDLFDLYTRISLKLPQIEKGFNELIIEETGEKISIPPPLRSEKEAPEAFLTRVGTIEWTNTQREKYGLSPLNENKILNAMAAKKAQDMFEKQYFAHNFPSGAGVDDLARNFGYEFIAIGENLASGNFENDEALVREWMESSGHRENILSLRYQEIGVAVARGVFEGKTTWLAVQHFGLPLSACPVPNEMILVKIEANQTQIKTLELTLTQLEAEIKTMKPKRGPAYIQKIGEYNNLVLKYNALVEETKKLVNQYNSQVKLFNECASGVD